MYKLIIQSRKSVLALTVFIIGCFVFQTGLALAKQPQQNHVLVLNSYEKGFPWTDNIVKGIESTLTKELPDINLKIEYMDSKLIKYNDVYKKKLHDLYLYKYGKSKFNVIITTDDNAFNFVREYHKSVFHGANIIFCGVNNMNAPNLVDPNRFTGILEISSEKETIELARRLNPGIKRVVIVVDSTPSGNYRWKQLKQIFTHFPDLKFIRFDDQDTLFNIEKKMANLSDDTIAIFATFYRDKSGRYISLGEGASRISAASSQPIYTYHLQVLEHGTIGGKLLGGAHHGKKAAEMVLKLIKGEKIQNIPIVTDSLARYIFDYQQLNRFNIRLSDLPENSLILNKPLSFYTENKILVLLTSLCLLILVMIIVALQINIVRRKQAEKTVLESHERLLTILDGLDAHIYVTDITTYKILFMNKQMINDFGQDQTGEICWDVLRRRTGPCKNCVNPSLTEKPEKLGDDISWEYKNPITDKYYINHNRDIDWTDNRQVRLQIATDITTLKEMEEELRQAHKMEAIGTLSGGIAHDFNNILSGIFGYAQLVEADIDHPGKVLKNIEQVQKGAQRAAELVQQILTYSRQTKYEKHLFALYVEVDSALKLIRSSIPSTIEIKKRLESKSIVLADPTRIHQVVMNLCTNAYQAMRKTGGDLTVSLSDIEIEQPRYLVDKTIIPGRYIKLVVSDTGDGMDENELKKAFEPYFTTKETGQGTGLGLALVQAIVDEHDSFLEVFSTQSRGTNFFIYFPIVEHKIENPVTTNKGHRQLHGNETLMIVDDEDAIRDIYSKYFGSFGYRIHAFDNGNDALEAMKPDPGKFDLIITDMTMPGITGDVFAEKVLKVRPDIPIILCTGFSEHMVETKAVELGIKKILQKPISNHDLICLIREILDE